MAGAVEPSANEATQAASASVSLPWSVGALQGMTASSTCCFADQCCFFCGPAGGCVTLDGGQRAQPKGNEQNVIFWLLPSKCPVKHICAIPAAVVSLVIAQLECTGSRYKQSYSYLSRKLDPVGVDTPLSVVQNQPSSPEHQHRAWQATVYAQHTGWSGRWHTTGVCTRVWCWSSFLLPKPPLLLSVLQNICCGPTWHWHVR